MRNLFVVVLMTLMFGCVTTSQNLKESISIGSVYETEITLGSKIIPLPSGKWTVIASGIQKGFFKVFLLKEHAEKKFSYIVINTDSLELERPRGYNASKYFDREDMYYKEVKNNSSGQAQDAWSVNHSMIHFNPNAKKPIVKEASKYIRDRNFVISNVMIKVSHRFTGKQIKSRYLSISYMYNPEAEGVAPVETSEWKYSDWHKMRINKYPQKVAFIEKMKIEGAEMHKKILLGLGNNY